MDKFLPVIKPIKIDNPNIWVLGNEIDNGESSIIYSVLDSSLGIKYILKYMSFENYYRDDQDNQNECEQAVINEVNNQELCSDNTDIAPKIKEAWICEKGAIIIMEKLDFSIHNLLFMYKSFLVRYLIVKEILEIIEKMHQRGIIHHDTHTNNFMVRITNISNNGIEYDKNNEYVHYKSQGYKYYVIDFGSSELINDNITENITENDDYVIFISSLIYYFSTDELVKLFKDSKKLTYEQKIRLLGYYF